MTQTIINLGTGGAVLNGRNGSTAGADSNDALFLDWPGDNQSNYVYLPGSDENGLLVANEAAFNFTTDFDARAYVAPDSWSGTDRTLVAQYGDSGNRKFVFRILTDASLNCFISANGSSTSVNRSSTTAVIASDEQPLWVRVTYEVNTGAGQYAMTFYTSPDGLTWTQLGLALTAASSTPFNSTEAITIGRRNSAGVATVPFGGKIYRGQFFNGINGTKVLDVDTSRITTGSATTFTALTGQTVTITRNTIGLKSVAVVSPVWLFGTDDYMQISDNALLDFDAAKSFTIMAASRVWGTLVTNHALVAKKANNTAATQGWLLGSDGSTLPRLQSGDGVNGVSATGPARTSGALTITAGVRNVATDTLTTYTNGMPGTGVTDTTTGNIANAEVVRIGRLSGAGTGYADMELLGVAVFRRALSAEEISAATSYYQARLS